MKPIADIRLYRSRIENIDGNSLPSEFASKKVNIVTNRIVMKLRENGFSLGDFDHLYMNFTTCLDHGIILPAKRSVDVYHKWYRYFDIGVNDAYYQQLDNENSFDFIIKQIQHTLNAYFQLDGNCSIEPCVEEALEKGEEMLMQFKEKTTATRKAVVYLRYLDNARYKPLLRVTDAQNTLLLEADLPEMIELNALGNIRVALNHITIEPRKNAFTKDFTPIRFDY